MKILVTGGAGFIGSNIIELLLEDGHKVFCLDDFSHANFKNIVGLDCELIYGDVSDENTFKGIPSFGAVIHQAAITDTTINDDRKMMRVNFGGFKNVLTYCLKKRIRLIYASSAGVYGNGSSLMKESQEPRPLNTYAYSKIACDRLALKLFKRKDILPLVGLRYFNVYGHREYHKGTSASMIYQLYLQMKQNRRPRVFKFGEQKRDFVYVLDVAKVVVKALELNKCAILNVGTGQARSFNEIIKIINKLLHKNLSAEYFDSPYKAVYQNWTQADTTNLKKYLGFTRRYSLEAGIKDYISILETQDEA